MTKWLIALTVAALLALGATSVEAKGKPVPPPTPSSGWGTYTTMDGALD